VIAAALVVGGLVLLTFAADRFVLGAARLSTALSISPVVIGVIVIGFGTSAPELVVTSLASLQGSQDIAFGNIVGSNTANMLLVLGAAALMSPIAVSVVTLRREVPLMLAGVVALTVATADGRATVTVGVALLVAGAAVAAFLVRSAMRDRTGAGVLAGEVEEYEGATPPKPWPSALLALLGLVGTVAGAQMLVVGATELARDLGISEAVIGLTVVAIGTSLPELVTAVAAARRKEADLVVGNVLGSNLFNSLPIAGVAAVLGGPELDPAFGVALGTMMVSCVLASFFLFTGRRLGRREGGFLLLLFAGALWLTAV
jgi:cation:H+ antiporter